MNESLIEMFGEQTYEALDIAPTIIGRTPITRQRQTKLATDLCASLLMIPPKKLKVRWQKLSNWTQIFHGIQV
ncbi:hypothetical protein HBF26_17650 [Luteibacter jiangsuensis]|uniref:Uncharacterized protein n=1 Tax=Luteibacter jiangsuensis TaxID=637577 RepID=A0ABX0QAY4_9GAMM|nr:hypothetical protein [Luteibacter jiangsuensis]NID06721.1 hypothetical protein [Luteibacter jiangsuensis]